ncbi:hypothetical protein LINGRAHAP2_LOCUS8636 [Linum grandiflorum]
MKVKTTAAEFRDLVQQLTGKDSDTARLMEEEATATIRKEVDVANSKSDDQPGTSSDCTTSGLDAFDDYDQGLFLSMVQSSFLDDLCQFDAFNHEGHCCNYGAL